MTTKELEAKKTDDVVIMPKGFHYSGNNHLKLESDNGLISISEVNFLDAHDKHYVSYILHPELTPFLDSDITDKISVFARSNDLNAIMNKINETMPMLLSARKRMDVIKNYIKIPYGSKKRLFLQSYNYALGEYRFLLYNDKIHQAAAERATYELLHERFPVNEVSAIINECAPMAVYERPGIYASKIMKVVKEKYPEVVSKSNANQMNQIK